MFRNATVLLIIFALFSLGSLQAQNRASVLHRTAKILTFTGNETSKVSGNPTFKAERTNYPDVVNGGLTFDFVGTGLLSGYDLQSNGTPDEIWQDPTNPDNLHAVYMNSQQTTVWSDRTVTYFYSFDGGLSWFSVANIPSTGEKSGYPSVNGFDDGTEVVALHSTAGGGTTRAEVFIDQSAGSGTFDMCDPGEGPSALGPPIWPRILGLGADSYVYGASISTTTVGPGAYINTGDRSCNFSGYQFVSADQAETYSFAYDPTSNTIGHLFLGDSSNGNLYYRYSTDGTVTWSDPVTVWQYNTADSLGVLRGCDLVMLNGQPCAVFEVDVVLTSGSYYPSLPSSIYFWSPNVNGGTPMVIADSSNVPFYVNWASNNDVMTPICRPTIGRSTGALNNDALFCAFVSNTDQYYGDTLATANNYYAGWFTYSVDSGKTWNAPVKFTPDETPMRDWRYVSMAQLNAVVSDSMCTVHMTMTADTIPGSTVNTTDPNYPVAVSAEFVGINTTVTIPQIAVGVKDDNNKLYKFNLAQNYPNPFNPTTRISYSIAERNNVSIKVYDMLGREVTTLVNTTRDAGNYEVNFDASKLASGLYIYKIQAGSYVQSKKMLLLK
ncbi:MAG TPA: T9SS type A sorting domain-containing protein [Ignavibacteriaceae bacterium]|nr:T9SS type A sorting domain-containing protein [Ignavibacteriaceae bacterium]